MVKPQQTLNQQLLRYGLCVLYLYSELRSKKNG
jgi:hypothetical protein